jgi:small conductance mechanosensitive channel
LRVALPVEWWAHPEQLGDTLGGFVKPTIFSLVILFLGITLSRRGSDRLRYTLTLGGFQDNIAILLARLLRAVVLILAVLAVLYQFGVGLTPLTAFIGIVGLAASLSLQQVLQNLVAGIYLLAERPFALQDTIQVIGPNGVNHEGRVEDIQMRTTHLRSRDEELILVPNAAIFGGVVTNRTAVGGCINHLVVTFPREVDPVVVRASAFPLLIQLPTVLQQPGPELRVEQVGKASWTAPLSFWSGTYGSASDVIWQFAHAFPDATVNDLTATPA